MRRFLRETFRISPLLVSHPIEFLDRLSGVIANEIERSRVPPSYDLTPLDQAIRQLEGCSRVKLRAFLSDSHVAEVERLVFNTLANLPPRAPFARKHSADVSLARMCYALVRAFAPEIVVETGVAYGVTTAFILQAMAVNGMGALYSVDLPPSIGGDAAQYVGLCVPERLKARWELHLGASQRILPGLLTRLGKIDMFMHDSLHTLGHMRWEFNLARRYLKSPALLVADDIAGNSAFATFTAEAHAGCWQAIQEPGKRGAFGVAILESHSPNG